VTDVIPVKKAQKADLVLVTGARGFVGRSVVKLLRREGYGVVALDRVASSQQEESLDITDAGALRRLFEIRKVDRIIHLAAVLPTAAQRDPELATQVNVVGSLNMLEMARRFAVKRFVFGSSLSVYGTCPADEVVAESRPAAPEDLYGAAKLYVEQLGHAFREKYGLEFVSLRIGRVVGAGAESLTSAWRSQIFEQLGSSEPSEIALPYVSSERLLLVHVDDVARMLVLLVGASGVHHSVYNAVCESMPVADLKAQIERIKSNISVAVGDLEAVGNPRRLDSSRFAGEFGFHAKSIFELLRKAARR
jgi:UDP-glucose 4-epimerase